jgi:hypothetical protein
MTKNTLTKIIEKHFDKLEINPINYINASSIGSDCLRQIWYESKGYNPIKVDGKTRRNWEIQRELEDLVVNWLIHSGLDVITGLMAASISTHVPNFKGYIKYMWYEGEIAYAIIDIKTAKDASFKIFVNKGLRVWNYQYYCKLQALMGMYGIFNAYILVLNKDNSELSDELITFDSHLYADLLDKAQTISLYKQPPARINNSPLWFQCKSCKFNKECHQ